MTLTIEIKIYFSFSKNIQIRLKDIPNIWRSATLCTDSHLSKRKAIFWMFSSINRQTERKSNPLDVLRGTSSKNIFVTEKQSFGYLQNIAKQKTSFKHPIEISPERNHFYRGPSLTYIHNMDMFRSL